MISGLKLPKREAAGAGSHEEAPPLRSCGCAALTYLGSTASPVQRARLEILVLQALLLDIIRSRPASAPASARAGGDAGRNG